MISQQVKTYSLEQFECEPWTVLQNIIWSESAQKYQVWFCVTPKNGSITINHTTKTITIYLHM